MDSLDPWRDAIERILTEHAALPSSYGVVRSALICDRKRDSYVLMDVGWKGYERIHEPLIHADIIDGKIWIQYDGTEEGIAPELVAAGVPRDRIVLAFKPEDIRKHTGFAAA